MSSDKKFSDGDKVQMTDETRRVNSGARSIVGVVINSEPGYHNEIKIKRAGLKTVETLWQGAWESAAEASEQ